MTLFIYGVDVHRYTIYQLLCSIYQKLPLNTIPIPNIISTSKESINHPSHYTQGKVECINGIESALSSEEFIGFLKGDRKSVV